MRTRGRPKTSRIRRTEQLRLAKRAQRERQRRAGIRSVQIEMPAELADKLKVARADPMFMRSLEALIDDFVVNVADYSQLVDLAWNRSEAVIPAREAFLLYERNRRFIDPEKLSTEERGLIDRLARMFGNGITNA
jgi:hypothetical protein